MFSLFSMNEPHGQHSPTCSNTSTANESERPLLKQKQYVQLFKLDFRTLVLSTFLPSVGSLIFVFLVGFGMDYLELLNYEWTCGVSLAIELTKMISSFFQKVLLPSISRILNLPKERVIWHLGIALHIGLRPIFIVQTCEF